MINRLRPYTNLLEFLVYTKENLSVLEFLQTVKLKFALLKYFRSLSLSLWLKRQEKQNLYTKKFQKVCEFNLLGYKFCQQQKEKSTVLGHYSTVYNQNLVEEHLDRWRFQQLQTTTCSSGSILFNPNIVNVQCLNRIKITVNQFIYAHPQLNTSQV